MNTVLLYGVIKLNNDHSVYLRIKLRLGCKSWKTYLQNMQTVRTEYFLVSYFQCSVTDTSMQCWMLYKRSATKSYASCDNLLSLLQLLDLPVVSAVCCLSSTHTSTTDSRVTTFWRNHFVEHETDTRILIISGPFSRRLKAHYLQSFTTCPNYALTFPASKLRWYFLLSKRWRNTEWRGGSLCQNLSNVYSLPNA